jgi:hypothetical protein
MKVRNFILLPVLNHLSTKPWSEVIAPPFLTSELDGGKWSALSPCRFTPRETATGIHWIWGWVGSRASLGAMKREKSCLCQELNPGHPASTPWLYWLSYPASDRRRIDISCLTVSENVSWTMPSVQLYVQIAIVKVKESCQSSLVI